MTTGNQGQDQEYNPFNLETPPQIQGGGAATYRSLINRPQTNFLGPIALTNVQLGIKHGLKNTPTFVTITNTVGGGQATFQLTQASDSTYIYVTASSSTQALIKVEYWPKNYSK